MKQPMKRISILVVAAAAGACAIASMAFTAGGHADGQGSPIYGITIPAGYRHWELISIDRKSVV